MKRNNCILLVLAFISIFLPGCDEKEIQLSKMCNCMDKKQDGNSNALNEVFGNNVTTVWANAEALDCAQQIQNEENLTYAQMIGLFQEFTKSQCGKQHGVDAASLDEATKNLKQEINNSTSDPNEENNSTQEKFSDDIFLDTDIPLASVDTLYTTNDTMPSKLK